MTVSSTPHSKPLCHVDDVLEGKSKGFEINLLNIFAVKKDNQIFLYHNKCPHLGVELNWQEDQFLDMDGALIHCSTHGALFLIESGECVAGPCQGQHLETIDFEVVTGFIYPKL